jgi:hypothetical protein
MAVALIVAHATGGGNMGRTVGAAIGALLVMFFLATVAARIHHTFSSQPQASAAEAKR